MQRLIPLLGALCALLPLQAFSACPAFLDQTFRKLHSSDGVNLCTVAEGKPLLMVNTASHCGFTSQFKGLEALHKEYAERGLVVVGFASDDFRQAARTEEEAATICYKNYGVTFLMLAPTHIKGPEANTVFAELARQSQPPAWNFNKYLVDRQGNVTKHFGSATRPQSKALRSAIEDML